LLVVIFDNYKYGISYYVNNNWLILKRQSYLFLTNGNFAYDSYVRVIWRRWCHWIVASSKTPLQSFGKINNLRAFKLSFLYNMQRLSAKVPKINESPGSLKADFHCCVFHTYVYARKTLNPFNFKCYLSNNQGTDH
jgi:hypothetical protein